MAPAAIDRSVCLSDPTLLTESPTIETKVGASVLYGPRDLRFVS